MNICVYGSSSTELPESIMKGAFRMGELIAKAGHGMVYGGGAQGVMGASAMGARSAGGAVLGVAPRFFNVDGVLFEDCTEFIYTDTMRERKQIMEDRSDAFIVCPGGVGTFEEFFEILTLKQLSQHTKPIVILDIDGYCPMGIVVYHTDTITAIVGSDVFIIHRQDCTNLGENTACGVLQRITYAVVGFGFFGGRRQRG